MNHFEAIHVIREQFKHDFPNDDGASDYAFERAQIITNRQTYLDDHEIQRRVDDFESGDHTIQRAADHGLLALAVPPVFGGLFVQERGDWYFRNARRSGLPIYWTIDAHHSACSVIDHFGTYAQFDFLLPQLAAGKQIATKATARNTHVHAEADTDGFRLSGTIVAEYTPDVTSMICCLATLNERTRRFAIPVHHLPNHNEDWTFTLNDCAIPRSCLLDGVDNPPPNTEKWRAMRWKTAPSGS